MKESCLYEKSGDYMNCKTCNHFCHIAPLKRGLCGLRENNFGKLVVLNYGRVIAEQIDPIEKKPLFHFLPGSKTLSIAMIGCNFNCSWCQNDDISQMSKEASRDEIANKIGIEIAPAQIIEHALSSNCPSISYTYTEPTIFLEFALDTMKLAKKAGLKNVWVSNGYFSTETLDLISPHLDAINIDLKGFVDENYLKYSSAKLQPVLDNIKDVFNRKIHLEVTTLIVPGVNDNKKQLTSIANFIAEISKEIPWHISKFFPAYKMMDTDPTPNEVLDLAEKIGINAGLKHIHKGNN
ncbi:TPA: AmmeMemoRadiSam system radical SAM enzyme [Candidatus Berkelbacteria bacterium]|uniref:Radical SAM protein, pyruvate formate lyase activating enzyme n=1 Tax=Berkelbacteria bacterium GW2011_GWE1_39_12 TaxID=1618337 RepID=A0A0G4B596_9BACT|nr:MAG: radical SAM protein, pyruvate formate lyase activating enzyme [Berkelbacteria bacterium GW2011_GWE1_39_12]HBO60319.1 AmmeMemoRadiSam system radical SAM enzyme [Candidatus Berkelbacteria bacterium]